MDERSELGAGSPEQTGSAGQLAALTARVAELERVVEGLSGRRMQTSARPEPARTAPPPPPPAVAGLPMIAAAGAVAPVALPKFGVAPAAGGKSLESRLGAQVFNIVGILALVLATAYGFSLAIAMGLIGPTARVLLGIAAGVGVVLWSERFRRKGMAAFSYSLKALGSVLLYLSLWAGFQLYHLPELPAGLALGLMVLVTAWNAYMAWSQDSQLLAAYALAGGFLTPVLLSTGGDHEGFLLAYVGAIDLAVVWLMRTKPWRWMLLPTFVVSAAYFWGWYERYYGPGGEPFKETLGFVLAFFAIFALVSVRGWVREDGSKDQVIEPVLLPLMNAAGTGVALFGLLLDTDLGSWRPWVMVGLAAVYLALVRVQRTSVGRAMHLALAVVFLTVAIPLKASGHTLTTAWLVEGLVLLWVSTRFEEEERQAKAVLGVLAAGGYLLGLGSLVAHWLFGSAVGMHGFFNRDLGAAMVAIATLGGAVWLAVKEREKPRQVEGSPGLPGRAGLDWLATVGLVAIDGVGVLLCLREVGSSWSEEGRRAAFANASFGTALVGLAVLAAVAYVAMRLRRLDGARFQGMNVLAAGSVIGFNLLTILSVEREIGALWHRGEEDLQRSLAISGFLMAYGAGLLAIGFVKRSAFVRWQALVLLLFTICKVFLYDISGLNALYRVVSFMGLGAVLMGISYAYQKDWLGLKEPGGHAAGTEEAPVASPPAPVPPPAPLPPPPATGGVA